MQPNDIITPLQKEFLNTFFQFPESATFFLTGGTALAAFYLQHRYSEDLDLFTLEESGLRGIPTVMSDLSKRMGKGVQTIRTLETIHQYVIQDPKTSEVLKLDFVREIPVQFGTIEARGLVRVDSLENMAVNKVAAILSRTEVKDFVDLYFILQKDFELDDLMQKAKQKDLGFTEFYFAGQLLNIKNFKKLPRMILPLELAELEKFYMSLADHIFDQLKPT